MSKQIRLPEEFVQDLRQNYDGKNDYERLKSWKNKESVDKLQELIEKIDKLDVNSSSTDNEWTRSEISDIAEDVVYSLQGNQ